MQHLLPVLAVVFTVTLTFFIVVGRRRAWIQRRDREERRRTHRAQQDDWDREHPPETIFVRAAPGDEPPPTA